MGCACNGSNDDAVTEYEVRLPDGTVKVVKGKVQAEMTVTSAGGGSIVKKRT